MKQPRTWLGVWFRLWLYWDLRPSELWHATKLTGHLMRVATALRKTNERMEH